MGILMGLIGALGWGSADFLAHYTTHSIGTYRTLFYIQLMGFFSLTAYLIATGEMGVLLAATPVATWIWTLIVGLLNTLGAVTLYRGYETGILAVVSPIASSFAAVTVVLAFISGERIELHDTVGIVLAIAGVVLSATQFAPPGAPPYEPESPHPPPKPSRRIPPGAFMAILSALLYGVSFWLLDLKVADQLGGIAPVWVFRLTTIVLLSTAALPLRQGLHPPNGRMWLFLVSMGVLDTAAYIATIVGYTLEQAAIVTVLASLFGAVTVLLGRIFLSEELERHQWAGVALVFASVVLVSI